MDEKALDDVRIEAGLSRQDVADKLHTTEATVGYWERGGNPRARFIPPLAKLFKMTPEKIRQVIANTKKKAAEATAGSGK